MGDSSNKRMEGPARGTSNMTEPLDPATAALVRLAAAVAAGHVPELHERFAAARQAAEALVRSEEHTSELQSRSDLVCRLLLEKKKSIQMPTSNTQTSIAGSGLRKLCTNTAVVPTDFLGVSSISSFCMFSAKPYMFSMPWCVHV